MAETPSTMIKLGTIAPDFWLPNPRTQKKVTWTEVKSNKATVIMFICNHCPYVLHILNKLVSVTNDYQKKGVNFAAINSNDVNNYPEDSPENMVKLAETAGFNFPYLFDESQVVAKAYHAACTPDFFIFDYASQCVYRGRFDSATPGNGHAVTGEDLTKALDAILDGGKPDVNQKHSLGCNIKWKT